MALGEAWDVLNDFETAPAKIRVSIEPISSKYFWYFSIVESLPSLEKFPYDAL